MMKIFEQLSGALETNRGVLLERAMNDLNELRRGIGATLIDGETGVAQNFGNDLVIRITFVGEPAGEHLVEDHTDGPDIGAMVDVSRTEDLLGRHVVDRPHDHSSAGEPLVAFVRLRFRDPEIEDLDLLDPIDVSADENVLWLQITMDDSMSVDSSDSGQDLDTILQRDLDREGSILALEVVGEGLSFEQIHDQEGLASICRAHVMNGGNTTVTDIGRDQGFAKETLLEIVLRRRCGVEELDGDLSADLEMLGSIDAPHAALSDKPAESILLAKDIANVGQNSPPTPIDVFYNVLSGKGTSSRELLDIEGELALSLRATLHDSPL
jgi:hypothetical protein